MIQKDRKVNPSFSFGKLIKNHFTNLRAGLPTVGMAGRNELLELLCEIINPPF